MILDRVLWGEMSWYQECSIRGKQNIYMKKKERRYGKMLKIGNTRYSYMLFIVPFHKLFAGLKFLE